MAKKKATARKRTTASKAPKSSKDKVKSARASKRILPASTPKSEPHDYEGWAGFTVKQKMALRALENNPCVADAMRDIKLSRGTFYLWTRDKPLFAAAVEEAKGVALDRAEAAFYRRAVEGVPRLVTHAGQVVMSEYDIHGNKLPEPQPLVERVYSDTLLPKLMAAKRPKEYGNKQELTGPDGGPIQTQNKTVVLDRKKLEHLTDDQLEQMLGEGD